MSSMSVVSWCLWVLGAALVKVFCMLQKLTLALYHTVPSFFLFTTYSCLSSMAFKAMAAKQGLGTEFDKKADEMRNARNGTLMMMIPAAVGGGTLAAQDAHDLVNFGLVGVILAFLGNAAYDYNQASKTYRLLGDKYKSKVTGKVSKKPMQRKVSKKMGR